MADFWILPGNGWDRAGLGLRLTFYLILVAHLGLLSVPCRGRDHQPIAESLLWSVILLSARTSEYRQPVSCDPANPGTGLPSHVLTCPADTPFCRQTGFPSHTCALPGPLRPAVKQALRHKKKAGKAAGAEAGKGCPMTQSVLEDRRRKPIKLRSQRRATEGFESIRL